MASVVKGARERPTAVGIGARNHAGNALGGVHTKDTADFMAVTDRDRWHPPHGGIEVGRPNRCTIATFKAFVSLTLFDPCGRLRR